MPESPLDPSGLRLDSPAGLRAEINANGALRRLDCKTITISLFVGNELEGGPTNLYLRLSGRESEWTALLGPGSPTRFRQDAAGPLIGTGKWGDVRYSLMLVLAREAPAWFWHVHLENAGSQALSVDLTYAQDLALAPYGGVRLNEFYVSQYVDHTPLTHDSHGLMIASRQNQAADGRNPWSVIGSLRKGVGFATDARQFHGLARRTGAMPPGLRSDLPHHRLQHEHSMVVIRDEHLLLQPRSTTAGGFFGYFLEHHPAATSGSDLQHVAAALALPEATPGGPPSTPVIAPETSTLFSSAPLLEVLDLDPDELRTVFGTEHRHEERDGHGTLLSFFCGANSHVVLREKELRVLRPHGHMLRTGLHLTPDESSLTSTTWMSGVFHSMLTQGHVSINRFLSTVHSYLGLFRSHGQRIFVEIEGKWHLLNVPSAFEMLPDSCRWIYKHRDGLIQIRAGVNDDPNDQELTLLIETSAAARFLISHHIAMNGDDGSTPGAARWRREADKLVIGAAPGGDVGYRFPQGDFQIAPVAGTTWQQVGGDELLFLDGHSRQQPFVCIVTQSTSSAGLRIRGNLIEARTQTPQRVSSPTDLLPQVTLLHAAGKLAQPVAQLLDIAPWLAQNALIHYLAPRGLEQYSGGGWGTRDVCQGPVELLLALGRTEPIRDLLLQVMRNQNPDGDWPQWFMFFERERGIRPGDSHGDIVFWPVLVLAQYLIASGDTAVLDERVRFFDPRGATEGEDATVWEHVLRALKVMETRVIPGTALAAYGHGDWNDALQPADPVMRERMCSAWTVTLHYQTLMTLAAALRTMGRDQEAGGFETQAAAIKQDFQRLLLVEGVLTGYAHFEDNGRVRYLLHPSDTTTGVHYSALAMIHAILEDVLSPEQAREHLQLIELHLSASDGVRLFDRPLPYHGGLQRLFQRAETATYFGREIGLMYTHAHLRYAQALAHVGDAERFFKALCQANPIAIATIVPTASLRQANCYYSSSDAAFEDRDQASDEYSRVSDGTIALDGGWRVYSSGAGIALGLILRRFLGLSFEASRLRLDPVMPATLDGLRVRTVLKGRPLEVHYRVQGSGCGVTGVMINNQPMIFERASNPHRQGAALVHMETLLERLQASANTMQISIG